MSLPVVDAGYGTRYAEPSDALSPASAATPVIPADAAFRTALTAAKAGSPSVLQPPEPTYSGLGTLPLVPISVWPSVIVPPSNVGGSQKPWSGSNGTGLLPLVPISVWPEGTVFANKAASPDEPPIGSSPAAQAAFYASRANDYAQSTGEIAINAAALAATVDTEAAIAGPSYGKTPKQIADAVANAKKGADAAALAARNAKIAAFDAGIDAAAAAAAQEDGDYAQAAAEANAAQGAMVVAKANEAEAYTGWGTVLLALRSLSPNV